MLLLSNILPFMVPHIFQSAFICIHISLSYKNWASGVGGRILRDLQDFCQLVYALKNPLTLSVSRICE